MSLQKKQYLRMLKINTEELECSPLTLEEEMTIYQTIIDRTVNQLKNIIRSLEEKK